MKFKKSSLASSPKMELLRRPSSGHRITNFKRGKSFRSSIKLISKIKNQGNGHLASSGPVLQAFSFDPKECNLQMSTNINEQRAKQFKEPEKIAKDFESKLSLGCNEKKEKNFNERVKFQNLQIRVSENNAYENPSFMDSSLDSSLTNYFYENDLDSYKKSDNPEEAETSSSKRKDSMKEQADNRLTVIVENEREGCKAHEWCTRPENKYACRSIYRRYDENNQTILNCVHSESTTSKKNFSKFAKVPNRDSENKDNILSIWSGARAGSFRVKGKSESKKSLKKELKWDITSGVTKSKILPMYNGESKLHSMQGMEFLEGFGKKKQQQQQRNHQVSNLSSIHINPFTAQNSLNIHLHALFAAVEHGHTDKARAILESTDVDINTVNSDGLSTLDVAVLNNNRQLAKMLVAFGAEEGNRFKSPESVGSHLASLLAEAEHRVQELGGGGGGVGTGSAGSLGPALLEPPQSQGHRGSFSSQHNNLTGCGGGSGGSAEDKQLALWERRARALRKMLLGFDQARPPDAPFLVTVDVTGTTSVTARFHDSEASESAISALCTKFKIQWSCDEEFGLVCGEREHFDMKLKECRIEGLLQGRKYYFRAASGNLKGYGRFRPTSPAYLTPSSWRDIDGRIGRFTGRLEQLDSLFIDVRGPEYHQETPALQRRNHKKKTTIKQLFTATSKFQKNLRRGLFLACLLYHDDKVLVTNEDFLPVIEVDETYPSCVLNDFHWLMKVSCTWDDVKPLKQDMEKSHSSSSNHLRIKLLQAATQMQAALCIQDLGQLYHKPIRDVQGTLVFSTVNYVSSPKLVSVLNSRWMPLSKLTKKIVIHEDSNVADLLMASVQEQMTYHQVSSVKLSRGLYLGYLKMQSSVDSIQVVVPSKSPNVLPHCKIRDNPHVSAEEWEYLKRMARLQVTESGTEDTEEKENERNASSELQDSEQQKQFIDLVASTARRLLNHMEISGDESLAHRLYDAEVIELSPEVSFLVAVPPAETACSVPGTREVLLQRGDLLSLPIQVFEMVHLNTYQRDVINRYSRLSCILELDTAQAQHNHREAFSSSELIVAKDKLTRLQDLQSQMNSVWKGARWLIDVITFARDRAAASQASTGICMKYLLSLERIKSNGSSNSLKRSLLQLPPRDPKLVKSSPGRGSWPGPTHNNSGCMVPTNLLNSEFSKSEQQLPSGPYPRKGSNSSNCSSASEPYKLTGTESLLPVPGCLNQQKHQHQQSHQPHQSHQQHQTQHLTTRLPPSKSEDTLLAGKYKYSPRSRSSTVSPASSVSASTSPLLGAKLISYCSTASESIRSISSDECQPPKSIQPLQPLQNKLKMGKPTASVASIADKQSTEDKDEAPPTPLPGILQVYAAYETGLASGTSLKLHVTPRTTAREVVDLVVKQLNMAVLLKGLEGPVYAAEELANFCLVAVIGARERCLRDDFKPLQLQNPWKKGRLYVRQKQDVLAALEHSSKHTAYL